MSFVSIWRSKGVKTQLITVCSLATLRSVEFRARNSQSTLFVIDDGSLALPLSCPSPQILNYYYPSCVYMCVRVCVCECVWVCTKENLTKPVKTGSPFEIGLDSAVWSLIAALLTSGRRFMHKTTWPCIHPALSRCQTDSLNGHTLSTTFFLQVQC